jgi:hypothetical protein
VSLTASDGVEGSSQWFLTRESGGVPDCGCKEAEHEIRKAYMVVALRDGGCCSPTTHIFAELSSSRVDVVAKYMLPQIRAERENGELVCEKACRRIGQGMFWSDSCTGCDSEGGICDDCFRVSREEPGDKVLEQGNFVRCFPNPRAPWWTGWTEAGWDSGRCDGIRWLSSVEERRRLRGPRTRSVNVGGWFRTLEYS